MTWTSLPPLLIVLSSLIPGLIIFVLPEERVGLRTALNLAGAILKTALTALMLWGVWHGERFETTFPLLPGMDFVLRIDALALLFVTLSSTLWLATTIYAIGYLEHAPHRSRFFGFFSLCVTATVGIAQAGNLLTLFLFYEILTLSTYPLVVHRGTDAALAAGRTYLRYAVPGGAALLVGIVWLHVVAGTFDFVEEGGALDHVGPEHRVALTACFVLMVGGFGVKAALVPFHGWLPRAMVAPAPVSALLHAVAVVKAGAFGIVRVVYDVYGQELAVDLGVTTPLAVLAAVTILYGSLRALQQDDLKRRLAFSTISQLSYIILGIALAGPIATVGGLVHLVHQGIMKITLFFCAGNLAETLGIHRISEMDGAGRRMPWTMAAFTVAALGMMGAPPVAGFISEWYLGVGALAAGQGWVVVVLLTSSALNATYFLPILYRAWFTPRTGPWPDEDKGRRGRFETDLRLLGPVVFTAALSLAAGLLAGLDASPLGWSRFIAEQEFP
ncbi:complex I subunit 5 family protein [Azospirillum halopraeferens]|uniref:complex I subunit 5 family protein n=1 Tax=Azospirillum halopraeferens TaxID=34010 RepID=UPI00041EB265|nr:monovalent cation/H+ antiporter subunit D family protein [Azospirillum halopraeferens]